MDATEMRSIVEKSREKNTQEFINEMEELLWICSHNGLKCGSKDYYPNSFPINVDKIIQYFNQLGYKVTDIDNNITVEID